MPRKVEISPFPTVLESLIFKMEKYFYERDEKKLPFNYDTQFISTCGIVDWKRACGLGSEAGNTAV